MKRRGKRVGINVGVDEGSPNENQRILISS